MARRLTASGVVTPTLPPEPGRGRWLRRLLRRLQRLGRISPALARQSGHSFDLPQLLLAGGLLALVLNRLGQQYPQRCGGAEGPNPSLATSLEQLDRSFRLRPGWVLSLELEPMLSSAGEPW